MLKMQQMVLLLMMMVALDSALPEIVRHPQLTEYSSRGLKNATIFDSFFHAATVSHVHHIRGWEGGWVGEGWGGGQAIH